MILRQRPLFLSDLAKELTWLNEQAGADVAERWYHSLQQTIDFISQHPFIGRERSDLTPQGIRSWKVTGFTRWLIFYQVKDERKIVFLRVRAGNMNLGILKMQS